MTSLNIPVWDSGPGLGQNGAGSVNFKGKIGCTLKPKVISSRSFYIEGRTVRTVFGVGVSNIWRGTFSDRGEKEWPWAPPGITEARSKAGEGVTGTSGRYKRVSASRSNMSLGFASGFA